MAYPAHVGDLAQEHEETAPEPRRPHKGLIITLSVIAAVVAAILLFLGLFDWDYVRGPVARLASDRIGRPVAIDGHLRVKLLSWTPTATVEGLRVANPAPRNGDMTHIRKLTVSVDLRELLRGRTVLPLLQADQPNIALFRDAKGGNNWTFKGKSPGEPTRLPAIRHFQINDGKLTIEDQVRHLTFAGTVSSSETVGAQTVQGFRLRGDGRLNNEPFLLNLTGGPLINVDPDRPYPFDAKVDAGATHILAKGQITKPFDLGVFQTRLDVTGADMNDLYALTGLTLPTTPPYKVSGLLTRNDRRYRYTGMSGRVGDSDIRGWVGVTTGRTRPLLTGDVRSRVLDFKDLGTVLGGGATHAKAGPPKASQVKTAQAMRATGRLLPDAPLQVERLRKMDADVRYRAETIRSRVLPVRSGQVHVTLDNALLKLEDLTLTLPQGKAAGQVAINARQATPVVDLDMRMTGARIEQFLPARFAGDAVTGGLVARAKLHGVGRSVHDAASTASGTVAVVMPHGEIRKAFAELMGVNVVKGLGLLLTKNQSKTDIRCAVANFDAKGGVLTANQFTFDTGPVLAQGGGTIDLRNETLNLRLKGKPKEFRLVRLVMPIEMKGPIRSPKLGVDASKAAGQVGLGAVLGSVLAPLATILPFIDNGLAKDANCAALIAQTSAPAPAAAKR